MKIISKKGVNKEEGFDIATSVNIMSLLINLDEKQL